MQIKAHFLKLGSMLDYNSVVYGSTKEHGPNPSSQSAYCCGLSFLPCLDQNLRVFAQQKKNKQKKKKQRELEGSTKIAENLRKNTT